MRISDWSSDVCSSDLLATGSGSPGTPTGQPSPAAPSVDDRQHDARRVVLRVMDCVNRRDPGRFVEIIAARIEIALIGGEVARTNIQPDTVPRPKIIAGYHVGQPEIGRASCRERVCQYGEISVGAVALQKKKTKN